VLLAVRAADDKPERSEMQTSTKHTYALIYVLVLEDILKYF